MSLCRIFNLWTLVLLTACVPEPEGGVAINVAKYMNWSGGTIEFEIEKPFLDARDKSGFDIVMLVVARDEMGALDCSVPSSKNVDRLWFDSSGNKWVRLGDTSNITYSNEYDVLAIGVDGIPTSICSTHGRRR